MTKEQEFRKQTEEAKFEAFSLMCKKVADLEKENATLKKQLEALSGDIPWSKLKDVSEVTKKLTEAKEIIENIIRVTWGEGWNYSLDWKVKADQFLKYNDDLENCRGWHSRAILKGDRKMKDKEMAEEYAEEYVKTEEIKKKFDEWIKENGGTGGVLYHTFSDDELEYIFRSAYVKNKR